MEYKSFLRLIFTLGTVWDFSTSFLGISGLLGVTNFRDISVSTVAACITAVIGGLVILGMSLYSDVIWTSERDIKGNFLRYSHIVTILYDAYSTFLGTAQNILLRDTSSASVTIGLSEVFGKLSLEVILTLLFLTVLITASPIMLPKFQE